MSNDFRRVEFKETGNLLGNKSNGIVLELVFYLAGRQILAKII